MTSPHWTPQVETAVAETLHLGACDGDKPAECPSWTHHFEQARAVLGTLTNLGMLPTTRTQWGVQGKHNTVTIYIDEATAREQAKLLRDAGHPARLLRRTITCLDMVQTSGWEPTPDDADGFVDQLATTIEGGN